MKEYGRKLIDTSASCLVVLAPERPQRLGPAWIGVKRKYTLI